MTTAMTGATTRRMKRMRLRNASVSVAARGFGGLRLGASLRTGSAIAAVSRCCAGGGGGPLLNRLAQIFLHHRQLGDDLLDGLARNAGQRRRHHVLAKRAKLLEHRPRRRRQEQPLSATVVGIRAALDQAVVAEPVE